MYKYNSNIKRRLLQKTILSGIIVEYVVVTNQTEEKKAAEDRLI